MDRSDSSWWVPLSVLCEGEPTAQGVQWLGRGEGVATEHRFEHGAQPDQWVLFNYNMIGELAILGTCISYIKIEILTSRVSN